MMLHDSHIYVVVLPVTNFAEWYPCDGLGWMEKVSCLAMCKGRNNMSAANDDRRVQKTESIRSVQKSNTMQPLGFPSSLK